MSRNDYSLADPRSRAVARRLLSRSVPIPVKKENKGNGHARHALLYAVSEDAAMVKPKGHKRVEEVPLAEVHLCRSAVCGGAGAICTVEEFDRMLEVCNA